jgi:hypothetical protein
MMGAGLLALWAGTAAAVTPAQKCQAAKLKVTGKYAFCRLTAAGGQCPTQCDVVGVEGQVIGDTTAFKMLQARWVDNLDGTVSDTQTGLMWEQKDDVAARLESLVLDAKAKGRQFEVIDLAA